MHADDGGGAQAGVGDHLPKRAGAVPGPGGGERGEGDWGGALALAYPEVVREEEVGNPLRARADARAQTHARMHARTRARAHTKSPK